MSDGIAITAGTGTTVATDDCGGSGHTQIVKLAISTNGSATLIPCDATDGLLVNLGTNNDVTVTGSLTNISGTISLPTGAATAAKQPALGTAGSASSDVITVQGIASMTPFQIADNSGSLTVDAPVGTPVFVRLSDGSSAITTLPVSLASVPSHAVTNAGTFAVQVDGSALTSLQLIDDTVYTDDAAFTPGTSKVLGIGFVADEGSTDSVDEGDIGAARMTLDRKQIITPQPHTAGGLSIFRSLDLDESEEEVKGSAGCIYKIRITNFSTSARYVKVYDNTAAGTTVGSTTPIDTIPIPGAVSASQPTVITEAYGGMGITCATGITVAATTALADADTGAPSANDVVVTVLYK